MYIYICICNCICIQIHIYIYIHIYMYICIHMYNTQLFGHIWPYVEYTQIKYIALHYITLPCNVLHYIGLHLHYIHTHRHMLSISTLSKTTWPVCPTCGRNTRKHPTFPAESPTFGPICLQKLLLNPGQK